jgi:hypothetical protein
MEEGELKEVLSRSSPMYFGCVSFKNFALSGRRGVMELGRIMFFENVKLN